MGTYVDGTWVDLGWPLGMMTMGVAAYLRRFLPGTVGSVVEEQAEGHAKRFRFGPVQALPYLLLATLFLVLAFNVLSAERSQQSNRPVLLIVTLLVVGLVVVRQIVTMRENEHLMREQAATLEQLERVYQDIAKRNAALETGVTYLKEIQTRLANGDVRARARVIDGHLWPLALGLNLMADRMMRSEQTAVKAQKLAKAVVDLSTALENHAMSTPFVLPASCYDFPNMRRLAQIIGFKQIPRAPQQPAIPPSPPRPGESPVIPMKGKFTQDV